MASVPYRLARLLFFVLLIEIGVTITDLDFAPQFDSIKVIKLETSIQNEDYNRVFFEVRGRNIKKGIQIKTTKTASQKNTLCENLNVYNISETETQDYLSASYVMLIPKSVQGELYFCLPHSTGKGNDGKIPKTILNSEAFRWYHQGASVKILLPVVNKPLSLFPERNRRDQITEGPQIMGLRIEKGNRELSIDERGIPAILANHDEHIRIFGINFDENMTITFTTMSGERGEKCDVPSIRGFTIEKESFSLNTASLKVKLPTLPANTSAYYVCVKTKGDTYIHQGTETWLRIVTYNPAVPVWGSILVILTCLCFSALFSGLNLGLMALDRTELKILCNTGTPKEKKYAKAITPVRSNGNYLLCSILLGNVFVNNIFTIFLDSLTSGPVAVVFSTLCIVLIGEITPQAICSRYGLAIGARTIHVTKFVMLLTFPLSYPVSLLLNWMLGEELGSVYNRERLKELVRVTTGVNDLDKDEVNIISGALELRKKTVANVMTKIEDVFMLEYDAVLDFETVSEIMKSGFSRVPVFEGNRQNIVTMLYTKDLAFVDPDDNTPLKTLCQFYQNPCNFVFEDVTLDIMFKIFKEGNKGHMALVHRVNNEGEGDPFYETIGLITLEDVIEELIQAEIMDETDVFTDNRSKRKRITVGTKQDFSVFAERRGESQRIRISPQLTLATFQYLSTSVEAFQPSVISETILRRLLKQDIICHIKKTKTWKTDPANIIYHQGKTADYFALVLEGRVEVRVGRENLTFEGGPFTYFGTQALVQTVGVNESPSGPPTSALGSLESLNLDAILRYSFQPDYTVRACTEVLYLHVKRSLYLAAKRATLMEKSQRDNNQAGEQFDEEVDKLLHSLEEDGSMGLLTPRKTSKTLGPIDNVASRNTSPKTPSLYSNISPPQFVNPKDVNGAIRLSNVDIHDDKEEEVSLLPHKS